MGLRRLSLQRRIVLLVGVHLVLVVIAALIGTAALQERDAAVALLEERLEPARNRLNELLAAMTDQESGLRGYLLSGDEVFLEPHVDGRRRTDALLEELPELVAGDERLVRQIETVADRVRAWQRQVADVELAMADRGRRDQAVALAASGHGREVFSDFRREVRRLRGMLVADQAAARRQATIARQRLSVLLWTLIAVAAAVAISAWWLLYRWITVPLSTFGERMDLIARGQLYERIHAPGPPEIVQLGEAAERMRGQIVGALDEAVAAREALEQRDPAALLLRRQLQPSRSELPNTVSVATALHPAEGVLAGDWCDAFTLDDGQVAVAIVDVSGHGADAGTFALQVKHLLHAALRDGRAPGPALGWVAGHLGETGERFLTGFVAVIDPGTGLCRYANAGHPPPVVVDEDTDEDMVALEPTGPILGPLPGDWSTDELRLAPGAVLAIYTDGILEARNGDDVYGASRVHEVLRRNADQPVQQIVTRCIDAAREFTGGHLADDVTLVAVRRFLEP